MSGRSSRRLHGGNGGPGSIAGSQSDLYGGGGGGGVRQKNVKDVSSRDEKQDGRGDQQKEVRISKLTRLLAKMDTEESFMTICGQIEGALNEVENQKYVYRFFSCLCPSFLDVFKGLSGLTWEAKGTRRFAKLLSKICNAMENQKVKFFQWIVDIVIRAAKGSPVHISSSAYVMEAVSINMLSRLEFVDIANFISCVYEVLEDVSNPKVFRVLGVIFVCGTGITATTWRNPHFQDFIDMVVGWMVDVRQSHGQFSNCAELLEQCKPQFENDLTFLVTLLSQLLEDLEQAIKKVLPTSDSKSDEFKKVLQLLKAFTSLLSLECTLDKSIVTEFCDRMVVSALQFIRMCEPHQTMDKKYRYDLLLTVNKAVFYSGGILTQSTTKYFRAQLKLATTNSSYTGWPKIFMTGFLESITVWIESAVSQTQLSDDIMEICGTVLNMMEDMLKNFLPHDQYYVVNLVIALLRSRNVTLLQKVYTWLIAKLPESSEEIEIDNESVLFVLTGLADIISNKSSSILSLWALQPPIFEVLVNITNMKLHRRTMQCAMELLRTHCNIHSHFVSAIASTGSFTADSPATRFLPALMDFWLEKARNLHTNREKQWLVDWMLDFLKSSNYYASLLYQMKPTFYFGFIKIITQTNALLSVGAKILDWFSKDPGYFQLKPLQDFICERLLILVLDEKLPEQTKELYRQVLYDMQTLLVVPDVVFIEDCKDDGSYHLDTRNNERSTTAALLPTEFNLFLYELLVASSNELPKINWLTSANNASKTGNISNSSLLPVAADHLIRLKLKTPIGKPQDFFMQLCVLLKRHRAAKTPVPVWKLHFVFELEKKFQLWTSGSAVDEADLTEHVRQFYLMNKTPFLEWLKRIRSEIIDSCLISQEYALAYLNAALMGDYQKMDFALFKIEDGLGLKGTGNIAAYLYLEGKYEEAMKLVNTLDEPANEIFNEIQKKSKVILEESIATLGKWPESQDQETKIIATTPSTTLPETIITSPNTLITPHCDLTNLLDFQLQNKQKTDISILGEVDLLEHLKLPALQKIHIWLLNHQKTALEPIHEVRMEQLERIRMDKMIQAKNLSYVAGWLQKKDLDIKSIQTDEDLSNLSLTSAPVATLKVCADYYVSNGDNKKAAILYNALREMVAENLMDSALANTVTINLCKIILESDDFFNTFVIETLNDCDRYETIRSLHQVATQCFPEDKKMWLTYGDFAYNQIEARSSTPPVMSQENPLENNWKYTTAECYIKYMQLSSKNQENASGTEDSNALFRPYSRKHAVMTRLLQLFRQGIHFDLEEVIKTEDWLLLSAEIAQIPEMRSYLVNKYPSHVGLLFTSHDSTKVKNKLTVKRRHLMELSAFSYVDISEEPLNPSVILNNLSQLEKVCSTSNDLEHSSSDNQVPFFYRSELDIPTCATVFANELLRLSNSMEDMWVWSLERLALDWGRRLSYLKKECIRSFSLEKIQSFVLPVITYLEAMLRSTQASLSPIDVNFFNRHQASIRKHLDSMKSCNTLEEVCSAINSLMEYSERFGLLTNNKLPVSALSPKLANPDFFQDQDFSICLPGQSSHLRICGMHSVVQSLPTKTKPKRIKLLADNGKFYEYLVKGTENLNIDCGVMQFLQIAQSFLKLPTRAYSVTPLGKRGGLIQIVPDAVPLFTLYKKHLQRNNSMEKTSKMFWDKMNALGFDDRSSVAAQREVFESLTDETSGDLITRELLLAARTPSQWLRSVQTFTKDCAVSSAIGYILGIGDRHLDNILLNFSQGKFVHVDFSILFGKGTTLRVPEKVPFRLTQNISNVLQYPGPSGAFFNLMQDVMASFFENKETTQHLIHNIAFSHMYDEDAPVDLTEILIAEIEGVLKLFQCRATQYLSILQALRNDILLITDDTALNCKIPRRMNRWRRMLVNLNTCLQFLVGLLLPNGRYENVKLLVKHRWSELFQNSLEIAMDHLIVQSSTAFLELIDKTETVILELQTTLSECTTWTLDMLRLQDSSIQMIDSSKVDALASSAEINIQTFNPSTTVQKLIDEATSVDNLAQMYEGWTSWV